MKKYLQLIIWIAATLSLITELRCQQGDNPTNYDYGDYSPHPFKNIGSNFLAGISDGYNPYLYGLGIVSTAGIIYSGLDGEIHDYFSRNDWHEGIAGPAPYIGYSMPLLLGGGLYIYGLSSGDKDFEAGGSAVLQASLISSLYVALFKAVTGRPNPDTDDLNTYEESKFFDFGFLNNGVHWGWPSGHMAVNGAAIVSLAYMYPKNDWIKIAGGAYLCYMFFGVISHEQGTMHWFSDAVAGSLIGYAVGSAVGRDFAGESEKSRVSLAPSISPFFNGVSLTISF